MADNSKKACTKSRNLVGLYLKIYGVIFKHDGIEKIRFLKSDQNLEHNQKCVMELLAEQNIIAEEIIQIVEISIMNTLYGQINK